MVIRIGLPEVTPAELDQLVARISEEIRARTTTLRREIPDANATASPKREASIARFIDHTILKPDASAEDVGRVCREAREYGFASACVNPYWVPLAAGVLAQSPVKVCTVVGFPLGANATTMKIAEADNALRCGAQEIDMVMNIGELRGGNYLAVRNDIKAVADVCHRAGAIVKVIIEAALLDERQKITACSLAKVAGADFVKTSTGFGPGGATAEDVALMRMTVGPEMGVKAAGGVRTIEQFRAMVAAGANRVGTSASVKIIEAAAG
jgi:deoxyribose-phosphate aldolase